MISAAALALALTASQLHWLNVAYDEGTYYGLSKYTQAIILVESSACLYRRGDDGNSLGCGQLQIGTAEEMCGCKLGPLRLTDENQFNIKLTAKFLSACFERFYPDIRRSIFCYNGGIPKASQATAYQVKHSKYVARVLAWLKVLKDIKVDTK